MPAGGGTQLIQDHRLGLFDVDRYRVAVALVTALRWLIVSPMFEARPTPPTALTATP